ncbi:MAG: aromatic acid exporter family protein [Candidatus Ventricola sp.]
MEPLRIPGVGMRTVKTALAVAFCTLVYYFVGRSPAFACIGVIFGMGYDLEDARKNGGNRLFGTIIGGVVGILLFRLYLVFVPDGHHSLLMVPLIFVGTIILIMACQMFWAGGVQPGGVVLCILLFNTPVATYIDYAMNRIFDTAVGVLIALFVSYVFPRGWMETMPRHYADMKLHAREAFSHVALHHPTKRQK